MDFLRMSFLFFVISWFIIFIYLYVFLYWHCSKEHKVKSVEKVTSIPNYINPANLSKLLYNKIIPEVFTSTVISLINKGILYFKEENDDTYIYINRNNDYKLSSSQKYALKLLIDYVGDGEKLSLKYLDNYSNSYNGSSNFYVNYQIWLKMIIKETNNDMYYEQKMGYYKIKAFKYAGILLWAMNFYIGFRFLFGYFLLIPAWYILYFYYKVYRRTTEAQVLYEKWISYKEYLLETKHIKSEDVLYSPILYINDKCSFDNDKAINRLNEILIKNIRRANSFGSKGPAI